MTCPHPTKAIRSHHRAEDKFLRWRQVEPYLKQVLATAGRPDLADSMPGPGSRGCYAQGKAGSGLVPAPPRLDFILKIRTRLTYACPKLLNASIRSWHQQSGQRAMWRGVSEARVRGGGVGCVCRAVAPLLCKGQLAGL